MRVELLPRRREAEGESGRRRGAGHSAGEVDPRHDRGVAAVHIGEDLDKACDPTGPHDAAATVQRVERGAERRAAGDAGGGPRLED